MDNNQMNGMQNSINNNVPNQVPVDNGIGQNIAQPVTDAVSVDSGVVQTMPEQMPINNGVVQSVPQQAPMNNGVAQSMPEQMPMNNGVAQSMPQQMPMNNGVVQSMPQQMPMNNAMPQGMPVPSSPKKSNTALIIIIIVLGVVILGLAGFIGVSLLNNDSGHTGNNPEIEDVEDVVEDNEVGGNVGQVDNSNTQTITHNGFTYKVDSGIVYQVQNSMLVVRNAAVTASAQMTSAYGSYAQYLASSESLKQELVSAGYGTVTYEPKKYNNRDYMIFSGTYQNIPFQFFIVGLDSTHVIQGLMITKTGSEWVDGYNMIEDFVADVNGTGSGTTSSSFSVSIPNTNNGTFFQEIK